MVSCLKCSPMERNRVSAATRMLHASLRTLACKLMLLTVLANACWSQQPVPIRQVENPVLLPPPLPDRPESLPGVPPTAMTLVDLENLALGNNPSIGRARALVSAAQGNWVQVGLPPNPRAGYLGQQLGSGGRAEQHGLLVEKEFVRGKKLELNRNVAAHEVARAEQQLAAQYQRVLTDVRIAFFDALLAQQRKQLAEQLVEIARKGVTTVEELKRAKEASRPEFLQATLELDTAEIILTAANNRHATAWRTLTAVVGTDHFPTTLLRGDLECPPDPISWNDALQRLLTTSPEIAIAVANIERARWAMVRARAEPTPNVTVQSVVMQDNGIGGRTDGIVQLTMPLPIINKNQGGIRQAESEALAAERALDQLERDLQNRLAPVFERYSNATAQVQRYRERILPAARESLDLVRRGYEAGEFPYLNLLNAQRTFFQTNLQYLDSLRELRTSSAEIQGMLLSNSLQAIP